MSYTRVQVYNLSLSILLLSREVADYLTDDTEEVRVLNTHWDIALESVLQDLDLDSTSEPITLELIETLPTDHLWTYSYKYPTNCAFFRRIESVAVMDIPSTHIAKRVTVRNGVKVIFTNEAQAIAECIPKDILIESLSSMTIMCVAQRLAELSAPLLVGKGAKTLRKEIRDAYVVSKLEAQETDARENFNYSTDAQHSEWVQERIS
jgi:hypothetical protein